MSRLIVDRTWCGPMTDGITLSVEVWRSDDSTPRPTVLVRTPYLKEWAAPLPMLDPRLMVDRGWNVVVQDVRGRGASEGVFSPFVNEVSDGADTVVWIRAQPWSNGDVAATGMSYVGATTWLLGQSAPDGLVALAPILSAPSFGEGWSFTNGVREHGFLTTWCASNLAKPEDCWLDDPLRATTELDALASIAPWSRDWMTRDVDDPYWDSLSSPRDVPSSLPVLHVGGWYDIFCQGTIAGYRDRANDRDRLLIGPWAHDPSLTHLVGDCNLGIHSNALTFGLTRLMLDFFEDAIRKRPSRLPKVSTFVVGEDVWAADGAWPPKAATSVTVNLGATSLKEEPRDPGPSLGGRGLLVQVPGWGYGPRDHGSLAQRPDVGVLAVPGGTESVRLAGPVTLRMRVTPTDGHGRLWVGTLCVRRSDGRMHGLLSAPVRTADETVVIPLGDIRWTLSPGERLEVLVSTAAWPRWSHEETRGGTRQIRSAQLVMTIVDEPAASGGAP